MNQLAVIIFDFTQHILPNGSLLVHMITANNKVELMIGDGPTSKLYYNFRQPTGSFSQDYFKTPRLELVTPR
jgi:hypothetical protein